ncbi:hypothetical protein LTSEMIN_4590, partial [Salmonella enterica subsp. enterica serovar Minnesota str. A4-603]
QFANTRDMGGGLDINPWRSNADFVPATGRLARQ